MSGDAAEKEKLNENGHDHHHHRKHDWNVIMNEVFEGSPLNMDINAQLVHQLLHKHYKECRESHI
jgi:hypothetical protein